MKWKSLVGKSVLDENNTHLAYSKFHAIVSSKYNACFPLKKDI